MLQELKESLNYTLTENGAIAHKSTLNECLDFFGLAGAMRHRVINALELFQKAYYSDKNKAIQILFYFRDIRGGQGERNLFRVCLKWLADNTNENMSNLFPFVVEHGRWDDLYSFVDTKWEESMFSFMYIQLGKDLSTELPSLLAKWMKSENTSSPESKRLARKTIKAFNISPRVYRKMLSGLREKINVLETKMSTGKWDEIDFDKLPSKASLIYRKAFKKHEPVRYSEFLQKIKEGDVKVKSNTLYPYELVEKGLYNNSKDDIVYLNSAWENLPNYLKKDDSRSIAVIDVSGSMIGRPMNVAISLGLYMAERNHGHFHNHFITFQNSPELLQVYDEQTFCEKIKYISKADWGNNTDLKATFDLILNTAIKNNLPQSELPDNLYIISDMEFDAACNNYRFDYRKFDSDILMNSIESKFTEAGYKLPRLIFWNVNAMQNQFPKIKGNVTLISGFSPSIFTSTIKGLSAEETMLEAIQKYSNINFDY